VNQSDAGRISVAPGTMATLDARLFRTSAADVGAGLPR
jgi:hypothetical protein